MAKYIDRDQFIDWLKTEIKFKDLSDGLGVCMVIMKEDFERAIKHMPDSIIKDVELVKHGHWIVHKPFENGKDNCNECIECSECNIWFGHDCYSKTNYCPNCGAKMVGE